jgi:hypothetical protein
MQPGQIIEQFRGTVALICRKKFLSDDQRHHQLIGAYDISLALMRSHPAAIADDTHLPEHATSQQLDELERIFRDVCVPFVSPPPG